MKSRRDTSEIKMVTLVDGLSWYDVGERISDRLGVDRAACDYRALHSLLEWWRDSNGWSQSQDSTLLLSVDNVNPSDGQRRFVEGMRATPFDVIETDFRDLYVSLPPGVRPEDTDKRSCLTFASHLTYLLGRLSRFSDMQVLIVSHCFELCEPMLRIKRQCPSSRLGIACFGEFLDRRWFKRGIGDEDSDIEYFDLEPHVEDIYPDHSRPNKPKRGGSELTGLDKY